MAALIQISAVSAIAQCLEGFEADIIAVNSSVYGSAGNNSTPFKVGTLSKNQKVCVSEKEEGNYVKIRYGQKTGYVKLSSLRSYRTEAVSACANCDDLNKNDEDDGPDFSTSIENSANDIRTATQKSTPKVQAGLNEPLPYADRIMKSVYLGLEVRKGYCARAVSRILRAADLLPGAAGGISTPGGFNGEDGYQYLSARGFKHDPTACKRPGVVLIYGQAEPGYAGKGRRYLSGDRYGHAEILGTDGKYYYYNADNAPINEILGDKRRPLKKCMVSTVGMNGGKVL